MDLLQSVFNHAVLPPKIPGAEDSDLEAISHDLLRRLIIACETVEDLAEPPFTDALRRLRGSLRACRSLNRGRLDRKDILEQFRRLEPHHTLILHVVEQNAAILIYREEQAGEDNVIFEAFETSPTSESVLAAVNALAWDFPGRSASLPFKIFKEEAFLESLAIFLEHASMESLHSLQAQARKANVSVTEVRDTASPELIANMLMPLIEALGSFANTPKMRKRIRDDVNIQGGEIPWRRLPFWLVLRVAAQRQLSLNLGQNGNVCYKVVMCTFFSSLLQDCAGVLSPELTITLRAKLCRRMAKLEMDKEASSQPNKDMLIHLLSKVDSRIQNSINNATYQVENFWKIFKRKTTRSIPKLPVRASEAALRLSLPNSGTYLDGLLNSRPELRAQPANRNFLQSLDRSVEQGREFTDHVFRIAAMESRIEQEHKNMTKARPSKSQCEAFAYQIDEVFREVGNLYDSDPTQQSIMILTIFELWMGMDKCAVASCPILSAHRPVFTPGLLDALQLHTLSSMNRLQAIQEYLIQRHDESEFSNIFSDIDEHAFGVRYANQSSEMQGLIQRIEGACERSRRNKESEWNNVTDQYDRLTMSIDSGTCVCTWEDGRRDVRGCKKCWHWRSRKRLGVKIHEDFLPDDEVTRNSVVFELSMPSYLSAYRNATWRMLRDLAHPGREFKTTPPQSKLHKCPPLKTFITADATCISLGSVKKCFTETHYDFSKGKVPLRKVLLPFAAHFELFDHAFGLWVKDLRAPLTLQHRCGIHIPKSLSTSVFKPQIHPVADISGPTSYEIQANQLRCPSNISIAEFSTYQKLLAGKMRRWPEILVELGSSNLNFSNEETTLMLSQLAVQAGPRLEDEVLRATHVVFRDKEFVDRLLEQIEARISAIKSNWRETNCMELLINLILRLFSLSSGKISNGGYGNLRAQELLKLARNAMLKWTTKLNGEIQRTSDGDAADRLAMYGFRAALLCRRTFEIFLESETSKISSSDLASWVQASVAMQENLTIHIDNLPRNIKHMMVRDGKLAYYLEPLIRDAIAMYPDGVGEGINRNRMNLANGTTEDILKWQFLPSPHSTWIFAVRTWGHGRSQIYERLDFCFTEGHLLVNGKPRGKLPAEMRDNPSIKLLFGSHHLFTYNSSIPGMTHQLATTFENQRVFFGVRNGAIVIRALSKFGDEFEFIPKGVFLGPNSFDLPASLLENCAHWLELKTGLLEVRRSPLFWARRPGNWIINIPKRFGLRGQSKIVDPASAEFIQLAKIFENFERPERLTVYQPQSEKGLLSVDIRHLNLRFYVKRNGFLFSKELKAEIDPNQDAGTWYGLMSKIVLREAVDYRKRMIIIPGGETTLTRRDEHVTVHIGAEDKYFRFDIDDILGRLTCAPEPLLLYTKAMCHAVTSFCVPDPLTRKTGTDEAFHILKSGSAKPWTALAAAPQRILKVLSTLLPQREYYPRNLKRLQKIRWDDNLTTTIQNDGLETLIREIETRSNNLAQFSTPPVAGITSVEEPSHLRRRAQVRRQLYERATADPTALNHATLVYHPRDRNISSSGKRVFQITNYINSDSNDMMMAISLRTILESWIDIGGFRSNATLVSSEPLISQIEDPIDLRWGDLLDFCRQSKNKYLPIYRLSLLAFSPQAKMDIITSLAAFTQLKELRDLEPPEHPSFSEFKSRGPPSLQALEKLIEQAYRPLINTFSRESDTRRATLEHRKKCEEQGKMLAKHLLKQWPAFKSDFATLDSLEPALIDIHLLSKIMKLDWARRQKNEELLHYVTKVDAIINQQKVWQITRRLQKWSNDNIQIMGGNHKCVIPSLSSDLLAKSCKSLHRGSPSFSVSMHSGRKMVRNCSTREAPEEVKELESILRKFAQSSDLLRQKYGQDLLKSQAAFKDNSQTANLDTQLPNLVSDQVENAIGEAQKLALSHSESITAAFTRHDGRSRWLVMGDLWPCVNPVETLEVLRSCAKNRFGTGMKEAIVSYGLVLAEVQRLWRIQSALTRGDRRVLRDELRNCGHEDWDPVDLTDWLLFEIDSNILIRVDQVDVARAIIKPTSGKNSVLQMNMGKGKTSCIMPMAAAVLANGINLSRLIVPKSLILQTAQTIQARLGGLVGRDICQVPFSRKTSTAGKTIHLYMDIHRQLQRTGGLLLSCQGDMLSFKLGGLQRLADNKFDEAKSMIEFQDWLNLHCRDILDESDFTLSVKTQLNYPSGSELSVDGHPYRWQVAQGLLSMVAHYVPLLQTKFPMGIEVLHHSGWFPMVQLLHQNVEDELHNLILGDICGGKAPFLRPIKSIGSVSREMIRTVLSEEVFNASLFKQAVNLFVHPESAAKKLLVVRGLIIHKILLLCLNKRWNVQYGLHPNRHPVAVPFEAKGVPSELSEFGHPDVAIVFTCISFYLSGLNQTQFHQDLQRVLNSEDPASEYEKWISECKSLPAACHHWNVVNLDDKGQLEELWTHLYKDRVVVDHYLNNFVFPLHARQFTLKLHASAWDLPLVSANSAHGARTTGFSGTNDNRTMLPLTIQQDDLPSLLQTNAEVLSYLLQQRNRGYSVVADRYGKRLTEKAFLENLCKKEIRILIDAGAYILEMENKALAKMWLSIDHEAKAAVYYGADNRAWVMFREDWMSDIPLLATPFANDLSECLVYLDEAHTRGVDLKLPENGRGALTLALKQTKDYTMQAAMRLRYLRTTQSVAFFAPPEVDQSIRGVCGLKFGNVVNSSHVIFWLLEQTCRVNEDTQSLYVSQGLDFCKHADARLRHPDLLTQASSRAKLLNILLHKEHQTLEQLYGDSSHGQSVSSIGKMAASYLQGYVSELARYENRVGFAQYGALDEVEQEREVELQLEAVRERQKPVMYKALAFPGLHPNIVRFVKSGVLDSMTGGFKHAFAYIANTDVGKKFKGVCSDSRIFVSEEFCRTVQLSNENKAAGDNNLRPVEWILWSPSTETGLIVIPEEAELLIPKLRRSAYLQKQNREAMVHMIAYAAPVTRAMVQFNTLRYYSLPPLPTELEFPWWFKVELGILSGRLYTDYEEWSHVAEYLGPSSKDNAYGKANNGELSAAATSFAKNPEFLLEWLGVRRRSQDVLHTPVGYICMGRNVAQNHPFFVRGMLATAENGTTHQEGDMMEIVGEEEELKL